MSTRITYSFEKYEESPENNVLINLSSVKVHFKHKVAMFFFPQKAYAVGTPKKCLSETYLI